MMDVETIFDSDIEEYEFMKEKKEKPMKEQIDEVKHCGCEYGLFIMPFAYDTSFLNRIKISTTILCTCCGKKVTRITTKGAVKAWNRKILKSKQ